MDKAQGKVKAIKIAHKIRALRTAIVAWYTNQASDEKEHRALELRAYIDSYLNAPPFDSQLTPLIQHRLRRMSCRAGQLATRGHHTPAR